MSDRPVIFLDFDGVVRVPVQGRYDFCEDRLQLLAGVCREFDAQIVISSDWRWMEDKDTCEFSMGAELAARLHPEWSTLVLGERWREVAAWLLAHAEVDNYAILDDRADLFAGCGIEMWGRVVLCKNRDGLNQARLESLSDMLGDGHE